MDPPFPLRKNELFSEERTKDEEGEHFRFSTPESKGASRKKNKMKRSRRANERVRLKIYKQIYVLQKKLEQFGGEIFNETPPGEN